ncbi:MAG: M14 family metallopeptidase [Gammaproteobacteria bacterium]|nr:M14 family metallopeptidase [Gammaproteobacteria bacterium]
MCRWVWFAAAAVGLAAAATAEEFCENDIALLDTHFEGGAFHRCDVRDGNFVITIRPEDSKVVVPMPWYAFRASPKREGEAVVLMGFADADADRFWPKVSLDGTNWQRMPDGAVAVSQDKRRLALRIPLAEAPVWIASQRLLTTRFYDVSTLSLAQRSDVAVRLLGRSIHGRPISVAETSPRAQAVLFIGRQHPPEVTGALTMHAFVDTVLADTELARSFREVFAVVTVPLLNPDGVANGHWRHNAGRTDLNRDWGPFRQPETQSVRNLLADLAGRGIALRLMLDFHATQATETHLFYTQRPEDGDGSAHAFAARWFERVRQRQPDLEFIHRPSKSESANAKNYFFDTYGIPSITYETGDETDPDWIAAAAPVFAKEMMRTFLPRSPN